MTLLRPSHGVDDHARGSNPRPLRSGALSGGDIVPAIAVILGVAILLALGVWQVQRLQWKEALLARIAALQTAPPEPLGVVLNRLRVGGGAARGEVDFVRVQAACPTLEQTPTLRLYAILDGVMGYRLITACPILSGSTPARPNLSGRFRSILVDRGFVPDERVNEVRPGGALVQPVIGVLRKPDPASWLNPPNTTETWHARNIAAMATRLNAPAAAPVFLMLESPKPQRFGPVPAAIPTDIPNNHLGYALTWFGLAAGLVGVYVASLIRRFRLRRGA